jgi:hypothetical protein
MYNIYCVSNNDPDTVSANLPYKSALLSNDTKPKGDEHVVLINSYEVLRSNISYINEYGGVGIIFCPVIYAKPFGWEILDHESTDEFSFLTVYKDINYTELAHSIEDDIRGGQHILFDYVPKSPPHVLNKMYLDVKETLSSKLLDTIHSIKRKDNKDSILRELLIFIVETPNKKKILNAIVEKYDSDLLREFALWWAKSEKGKEYRHIFSALNGVKPRRLHLKFTAVSASVEFDVNYVFGRYEILCNQVKKEGSC